MKIGNKINQLTNNYTELQNIFEKSEQIPLCSNPYKSILNVNLNSCDFKISIIMPSWNTPDIVYTLKSIESSTFNKKFPNNLEVVIIDDGSDIPIKEILTNLKLNFDIILIRQKHLGRAYAINTGVYCCSGEVLLFLDSDIILLPTTIEQIALRLTYSKDTIFFGFRNDIKRKDVETDYIRLLNQTPKFYEDNRFSYDFHNSWSTNMMRETNFLLNYPLKTNFFVSDEKSTIDDCWQSFRMVYGFLFSTSKESFIKLGGFDERLSGWGWDDSIYIARALSQGINIVPVSSAHCLHIFHNSRTSDQWGECANNFKIVKKNLNEKSFQSYTNIDTSRIEYIYKINQSNTPSPNIDYKSSLLNIINDNLHMFDYHYHLGNYKEAVDLIENINNLSVEQLNNYVDALIRLNYKEKFNLIKCKRLKNCFYYYIAQIYFNKIFSKPSKNNTKNITYLFKFNKKQHKKRAKLFYKQQLYYMALLDYCASYFTGDHHSIKKINKLVSIIRNI